MDKHGETDAACCGVTGFWMGPLSQKLVCDREAGHTGTHIAALSGVSVAFTDDDREDGTACDDANHLRRLAGALLVKLRDRGLGRFYPDELELMEALAKATKKGDSPHG